MQLSDFIALIDLETLLYKKSGRLESTVPPKALVLLLYDLKLAKLAGETDVFTAVLS